MINRILNWLGLELRYYYYVYGSVYDESRHVLDATTMLSISPRVDCLAGIWLLESKLKKKVEGRTSTTYSNVQIHNFQLLRVELRRIQK